MGIGACICGGTGVCPQCDGKGTVVYLALQSGKCTLCSATGRCPNCRQIPPGITASTLNNKSYPPQPAVPTERICPRCGGTFNGNRCWVCVARIEDINQTLFVCYLVGPLGLMFGYFMAHVVYPALEPNWLVVNITAALLFIQGVIASVPWFYQRLTRYARFVRIMLILMAITCSGPSTYYFLNGIFDQNPPTELPSHVYRKYLGSRGGYVLVVRFSWNQRMIEHDFPVSPKAYSAAVPGEYIRVIVHPGAFSEAWSDQIFLQ